MLATTKVIFTSIMIGFGGGGDGSTPLPAPTMIKETIILKGDHAMAICRQMEEDFHYGMVNYNSETRRRVSVLVEPNDNRGRRVSVQRESRCSEVKE